jgi:hypothetical protein
MSQNNDNVFYFKIYENRMNQQHKEIIQDSLPVSKFAMMMSSPNDLFHIESFGISPLLSN